MELLYTQPMLVEAPIGNIHHAGICGKTDTGSQYQSIDWLDLTWLECRNRFARKRTRAGKEVRLLIRLGQHLKNGDLLGHWPDGQSVVVNLLPTQVLVVRPPDRHGWLTAVYQIGNLHVPLEIATDELLLPSSCEAESVLVKHGLPFESTQRLFQPTHWPAFVQLSPDFQIKQRRARPPAIASESSP